MRIFSRLMGGLEAIVLLGLYSAAAWAQAPAAPASSPTLWSYLGIPQGVNKLEDATWNRSGNRPDAERTNPLTRIADPANLSDNMPKSIQTAAKIKQQEDLAPQKIKAIKYLATVGCGCYQKMGVREALLESLDDCTEEVRYEAACGAVQGCRRLLRQLRQHLLQRQGHEQTQGTGRRQRRAVLPEGTLGTGPPGGPPGIERLQEQAAGDERVPRQRRRPGNAPAEGGGPGIARPGSAGSGIVRPHSALSEPEPRACAGQQAVGPAREPAQRGFDGGPVQTHRLCAVRARACSPGPRFQRCGPAGTVSQQCGWIAFQQFESRAAAVQSILARGRANRRHRRRRGGGHRRSGRIHRQRHHRQPVPLSHRSGV